MKSKTLFVFLSMFICLAFLLSSCTPKEVEPVVYESVCGDSVCSASEVGVCDIDCDLTIEQEPTVRTSADILEEFRSRIRNYTHEERLEQENPVVEGDEKILVESFTSYLPEKGFRVASRYNLLSIGENLSDIVLTLNKLHLREILRSGRLSSNTEAFGPRAGFYEQFLKLRGGRVVFGFEEDKEVISTYLLFEEEGPVFDYLLELQGGIFKFFEGESIHFLGHEYIIEEVTNNSMKLVGVTTPDTILFRNKHGVRVNNAVLSNDMVNVTLEHDYLRLILLAQEDIRILPGTGLRSYLSKPEALLTNRLDIVYEGLTDVPVFDIEFDKRDNEYKIGFTTNKDTIYNIPLVYLNPFKLGDDENSLVYKEGADKSDYIIKKKDYFIISNNREYKGLTTVLRLVNVGDKVILFEDPALEKFYVYYEGTPGVNASAELIVDNVLHKVYVGINDSISVDLDGNGRINEDEVPIITAGNGMIRLEEAGNDAIGISLITPGKMREGGGDLAIGLVIRENDLSVDSNDLKLIKDRELDALVGMTDYGALFILEDYSNPDEQTGKDLIIKYPLIQRFADVIVKGYE